MTKNIGPMNPDFPPFGEMTLNGREITHHMDVMDFPEEGKARDACMEHVADGRMSDMMGEFWITGCHFPKEDEPQVVRTAFICSGPSMLKKCRLRMLQARVDGEVLTEGKYQD